MHFLRSLIVAAAATTSLLPVRAASDVVDLTADNFKKEVLGEDVTLVEFFAPWCGHCKNLAPHYEEAATELKTNHNIKIAKVDCTENQELCGEYGVQGYPTLKVFRSGEPSDYTGPRKADGIISYMVKQSLPAMSLVKKDDHEQFKTADKVVLIAYYDSEDSVPKAFKQTADKLRDTYLFGYSTDVTLSPTGKSGIVLYKKFDEGTNVFTNTPITSVGLTEFIKENSIPILDQVSPENFASYADQGLPIAYIFSKPNDERLEPLLETIKPIAKSYKGKINFVWIDAIKFEEHAKALGVPVSSDPYPVFVIQDLAGGNKRYVLTEAMNDDLNDSAVKNFVSAFEDGQIQPTLKSAAVPSSQDEPVYILVGKEFEEVVFDDGKDVFVEVYAPWCGHCQRLSPIWDSLAEHFEEFKDTLTIAKMDGTENDLPVDIGFEVQGFPTIKFKAAGTREFIDYEGDRSFDNLVAFIKEHSNNPVESTDEVDSGVEVDDVEAETEHGHHDEL